MPTSMVASCKGMKQKTPADPIYVCTDPSYAIAEGLKVLAKFEYSGSVVEPVFSGVELQVSNKNIGKVKDLMIAKYGRPMDVGDDDKMTRGQAIGAALFGGPTTMPKKISEWYGEEVNIVLVETEQAFGRSTVSIRQTDNLKAEAAKSVF